MLFTTFFYLISLYLCDFCLFSPVNWELISCRAACVWLFLSNKSFFLIKKTHESKLLNNYTFTTEASRFGLGKSSGLDLVWCCVEHTFLFGIWGFSVVQKTVMKYCINWTIIWNWLWPEVNSLCVTLWFVWKHRCRVSERWQPGIMEGSNSGWICIQRSMLYTGFLFGSSIRKAF